MGATTLLPPISTSGLHQSKRHRPPPMDPSTTTIPTTSPPQALSQSSSLPSISSLPNSTMKASQFKRLRGRNKRASNSGDLQSGGMSLPSLPTAVPNWDDPTAMARSILDSHTEKISPWEEQRQRKMKEDKAARRREEKLKQMLLGRSSQQQQPQQYEGDDHTSVSSLTSVGGERSRRTRESCFIQFAACQRPPALFKKK